MLDFVADVVAALAWPVAVVVAALILRRPLSEMVRRHPPSKVKFGPVEAEWARAITEVESEVGRPDITLSGITPEVGPRLSERYEEMARVEPSAAIYQASLDLRRMLRDRLHSTDKGVDVERLSMAALSREALNRGAITPEIHRGFEALGVLGNLAFKGGRNATSAQAEEFLAMADAMGFALAATPAVLGRDNTGPTDAGTGARAARPARGRAAPPEAAP